MRDDEHRSNGVFRPCEVEQMRRELKSGDRPGESPFEREQRAIAIIDHHSDRQSLGQPARIASSVPHVGHAAH